MTLEIRHVPTPLCDWENCSSKADYEFSDYIEGESVILARACFNHVEEINKSLKKIEENEHNVISRS